MSAPLPGFLRPITLPLSWGYQRIIRARNARYDRGIGVERVAVPVISVGNITTGGTGKTPMVAWAVERLRHHGCRPAIAMRGYGATSDQPSDEQLEYAERLPDVPVIANPDRTSAVREFLAQRSDIDCVILDDGFQHRQMHRDLDIVLIDATRQTFADRLLPAGHLREPLDGLARADAVAVTRAERADPALAAMIEQYHRRPPLAWANHAWKQLLVYRTSHDEVQSHEVGFLRGKRVVTLLGVGNPQSIIDQVEAAGAAVAATVPAGDHERFTSAKLRVARGLCDGADALLVTGKDWVKMRAMPIVRDWPLPIVVPVLTLEVHQGGEALEAMLMRAVGE